MNIATTPYISSYSPFQKVIKQTKDEFRERAQKELKNKDTYFSLILTPLCFSEVILDLADSVRNMLSILKIEKFKKLNRLLRECIQGHRAFYKSSGLTASMFEPMQTWNDMFWDVGNDKTYKPIYNSLSKKANVDTEYMSMMVVAWQTIIYSDALIVYTEKEEAEFAKKIGLPNMGHLLSDEIFSINKAMKILTEGYELSQDIYEILKESVGIMIREVGESGLEPPERCAYRHACIGYICHRGCLAFKVNGPYGCFPSSQCKRMQKYDQRHRKEVSKQ